MDLYFKLKNKFLLKKINKIEPSFNNHSDFGSFVTSLLPKNDHNEIQLKRINNGLVLILKYHKSKKIQIEYIFKNNKDGLLLLRGAEIKMLKVIPKKISVISRNSIPDFAVSAKPLGNDDYSWVPVHGKNTKASVDIITSFLVDGKVVSIKDLNKKVIDKFQIVQTFNAVNCNYPNDIMWRHTLIHSIDSQKPVLSISNTLEFVKDTEIKNMYLTMLPTVSSNMNKLHLNDGSSFNSINKSRAIYEGETFINSAMYIGEKYGVNYVCAVDSINEDIDSKAKVTFRGDNITKFYMDFYNGIAKEGTIFKAEHRLLVSVQ